LNFAFNLFSTSLGTKELTSPPIRLQPLLDFLGDEGAHVAAHGDGLLDEARADERVLLVGHHEDGLDVPREGAVRERHLVLVLEVGDGPDAAEDDVRLLAVDVVHHEAVERVHLDVPEGLAHLADHLDALLLGEERLLRRVVGDGDDEALEDADAALDDVEMPVGDGVEAAGIDGDAHGLPTLLYVKPSSRTFAGS
jgi:hypothetical protein